MTTVRRPLIIAGMISVITLILMTFGNACSPSGSSSSSDNQSPPQAAESVPLTASEQACIDNGWQRSILKVGGLDRKVMWKTPVGAWSGGAILLLHGADVSADHFCSTSSNRTRQNQLAFSNLALDNGFAVFSLEATNNVVTDELGRPCKKRFDYIVSSRPNVDLPFIEQLLIDFIPSKRFSGSNTKMFITGFSTGGYMAIRAGTRFDGLVTAFAAVAGGDPYGTNATCDPDTPSRGMGRGALIDRETNLEVYQDNACEAALYQNEHPWESQNPVTKPRFKILHNRSDGNVDVSCAEKANKLLKAAGYIDDGIFLLNAGDKNALHHMWWVEYNNPLINFFMQP